MPLNESAMILTKKEVEKIKEIIEGNNNCECDILGSFNTIWFRSLTDETELRLLFLGNIKITISRVCFTKKNGCMTKILNILKEICEERGIKKIVIQSTMTEEIVNFCNKNSFIPDPTASFEMNGLILGDYYLNL